MNAASQQPALVTGASGFIGTRLVRRLLDDRRRVFCLVRTNAGADELRSVGATALRGDVTDRDSVVRALDESEAETVFQLAGVVRTPRSAGDRDGNHPDGCGGDFMRVNAGGVETVAAACADRSRPPVLVAVSSLAAAGPSAASALRGEGDVSAPISEYGRSKLAGECAAANYAGAIPITIVRPSIVFGPGDRAVLEWFRSIDRWGIHVVPGWRDRHVSLVHVDDLVEAVLLAASKGERLAAPGAPGAPRAPGEGVYFIAGEEHPTYAQLGLAIASALGRRSPVVARLPGPLLRMLGIGGDVLARVRGQSTWINSDKITEALAGDWTCSADKARAQLGWCTAAALSDRLRETAEWYRRERWL